MSAPGSPTKVDFIVVGGGLAGALLAWTLRDKGHSIVLFDGPPGPVCSRAAAGLYHPLTGRRLSTPAELPALHRAGLHAFGSIAQQTGRPCLHPLPIRRSFNDAVMAGLWLEREKSAVAAGLDLQVFPPATDGSPPSPFGGYQLHGWGWVDPDALIGSVTEVLAREGRFLERTIRVDALKRHPDGVVCAGIRARAIVFAEGHLARDNPAWRDLPLKRDHGEILEVEIEAPIRPCIHLGDLLLIPRGDKRWLAGATHEWTIDHGQPTVRGRLEIESRLKAFLRVPFTVVGHRAGLRPASGDTRPLIGQHREQPALWIFNGFGSRTLLLAPWCAERLERTLSTGEPLPPDLDITRFASRQKAPDKPFRATRAAQTRVAAILRAGDRAIDLTAGRGHDTLWLAGQVRPDGRVLAMDIQAKAVEETAARLRQADLVARVILLQADHATLDRRVPPDWAGQVAAILFHSGALPQGDRTLRTRPESTLKALAAALPLLRPAGRLTLITNPGDPDGRAEHAAIRSWLEALPVGQFSVEEICAPAAPETAPRVIVVSAGANAPDSGDPRTSSREGPPSSRDRHPERLRVHLD